MKKIMLLGTASSVGKSTVATAFCRYFKNQGYRVAPFKALNISLNSYVTEDGLEMGRAQVVQAEACGITPKATMNPVLLKPSGNNTTQVIVNGKVKYNMNSYKYKELNKELKIVVKDTFEELSKGYDVMILEGSGSCAEINLRETDIANMSMAKAVEADVVLVADIDRGGVFASVLGTIMLLEEDERKLVKGVIINKFRGNVEYFKPAMKQLEELINIPVLGVMPYTEINIEDEDSVTDKVINKKGKGIDIVIIRLPYMSNFTDFNPLEALGNITVRYVRTVEEVNNPDLIIIPGTKNTINDLKWLKETGLFEQIEYLKDRGHIILGICGGYQILGKKIIDQLGIEGEKTVEEGFGFLDSYTVFDKDKTTIQSKGIISYKGNIISTCKGIEVRGYEIHNGKTIIGDNMKSFIEDHDKSVIGTVNKEGNVLGTYLHGIFDNDDFLKNFIDDLRKYNGVELEVEKIDYNKYKSLEYDKLAKVLEENVDLKKLLKLIAK